MKIITTLIGAAAICLFVSCDSKSSKTVKAELTDRPNNVEITTHQIQLADGEWTEIVIKQTLSYKSPMVVENISTDLAGSMQFGVQRYTDEYDLQNRHVGRTMIIHARSLQRGKEIVLTKQDFVFKPSIIGWQPVHVLSSKE